MLIYDYGNQYLALKQKSSDKDNLIWENQNDSVDDIQS